MLWENSLEPQALVMDARFESAITSGYPACDAGGGGDCEPGSDPAPDVP